jgi:division protein CdvB (Snf7/Vps24/ESCRT-III family)
MDQHQQELRSDMGRATSIVNNQLGQLRMLYDRFSKIDNNFKNQIAANIKSGNNSRAKALARELVNIQNVQKTTQNACLALEVMLIRFNTLNEFTMVMETIEPTVTMIRDIQQDISKVMPTASSIFSEMKTMTSEVMVNSDMKIDLGAQFSVPVDKDALSILNEIEGVLENEAKAKLPEVPLAIKHRKMENYLQEQEKSDSNKIMIEG